MLTFGWCICVSSWMLKWGTMLHFHREDKHVSNIQMPLAFVRLWLSLLNFTFLCKRKRNHCLHYSYVIIGAMVSQISGVSMICSTVCSGADRSKKTSKLHVTDLCEFTGPVLQKMFTFDDVTTARETWSNAYIFIGCIMPARDLTHSMLGHLQTE